MNPWPDNCKIYKTSNPCNRYELSRAIDSGLDIADSRPVVSIISCDLPEMCIDVVELPECLEYYDEDSSSNDEEDKPEEDDVVCTREYVDCSRRGGYDPSDPC